MKRSQGGRGKGRAWGLNSVGPRVESEMKYSTVLHLRNGSTLSVSLQEVASPAMVGSPTSALGARASAGSGPRTSRGTKAP